MLTPAQKSAMTSDLRQVVIKYGALVSIRFKEIQAPPATKRRLKRATVPPLPPASPFEIVITMMA